MLVFCLGTCVSCWMFFCRPINHLFIQPGQRSVMSYLDRHGLTDDSWAVSFVYEIQQAAKKRDARASKVGSVPRLGWYMSRHICLVFRPSRQYTGRVSDGVCAYDWHLHVDFSADFILREKKTQIFRHRSRRRLFSMRHWDVRSVGRN